MAGLTSPPDDAPLPRGRHAPPLEVRVRRQRSRLFAAAAAVFAQRGYGEATAEAIAREAGMSKATFYQHFANKEECFLALMEAAGNGVVRAMLAGADAAGSAPGGYEALVTRSVHALLETLAAHPLEARTLLVEGSAAGPRSAQRRDEMLDALTRWLLAQNAARAQQFGAPVFADELDAATVVGGIVEAVSRQLRTGRPEDVRDLEPTLLRLVFGVLAQARAPGLPPA